MYATAQRVRARDKQEGINAFLFLHGARDAAGSAWTRPDIAAIADQHPGTLVVQRIEQDYGGNDVLSYLDVAASDSYGIDRLRTIVAATAFDPTRAAIWSTDLVAFRFFYSNASYHDVATEFAALRDHVLLLLASRRDAESARTATGAPLRIIAEDNEGLGIVYRLDVPAQQRLLHAHPRSRPARVRIGYEERKELAALWGDDQYHHEIALLVTGLSSPDLAQLGGAIVRNVGDRQEPQQGMETEELAGQVNGDWIPRTDEPIEAPPGWPTGAILQHGDYALDLVYIERAWYPLSEAGIYTYLHSAGLKAGVPWRFVTRTSPRMSFRVSFGPTLTPPEVAQRYGPEAAARCRQDRATIQLRLTRES